MSDMKNTIIPHNCMYCNEPLKRKRFGKRLEDISAFNKRKFCDRECMRMHKLTNGIKADNYGARHESARNIASLTKRIEKCEICGKTTNLDVHHKDENYNNNSIDNLIVLCRSCHMKIHNKYSICKVDGCNEKVKGHGYCDKHYQRFRKYGNPYTVLWNTKHTKYDLDVKSTVR